MCLFWWTGLDRKSPCILRRSWMQCCCTPRYDILETFIDKYCENVHLFTLWCVRFTCILRLTYAWFFCSVLWNCDGAHWAMVLPQMRISGASGPSCEYYFVKCYLAAILNMKADPRWYVWGRPSLWCMLGHCFVNKPRKACDWAVIRLAVPLMYIYWLN